MHDRFSIYQVEKPVVNRLRLIRTQDWSRLVQDRKKAVLSSPVRSFEVLGLWWTGLGLGPSPWGWKTGPDWTFKHYWCQSHPVSWRNPATASFSLQYLSCNCNTLSSSYTVWPHTKTCPKGRLGMHLAILGRWCHVTPENQNDGVHGIMQNPVI